MALSEKEQLQDEFTDSEKHLNEGDLTIHELERASNNLEVELTIVLEEAETRLQRDEAELLCVHFRMT